MRWKILFIALFVVNVLLSQFHPPAGQNGTSAIFKDSNIFVNWADRCLLQRGYMSIAVPDSGFASVGDTSSACGGAGMNGVLSLGDGGIATLGFPYPITNGPGYDFAVFENSFSDDYLEMAFVEVSSDGLNFFRFPSVSNTQDSVQCGPFGLSDASKINNLAGKYRMNFGTPFDLQELQGTPGLDLNYVTHIRVIDVIGSVDSAYASFDIQGKKINDPWPTLFPSSGFDLDAVGVIHQLDEVGFDTPKLSPNEIKIFQSDSYFVIQLSDSQKSINQIEIFDVHGRERFRFRNEFQTLPSNLLMVNHTIQEAGIFTLLIRLDDGGLISKKIVMIEP